MKNGQKFDWTTNERVEKDPDSGTLTIINPRMQDLGYYQCFAENRFGIATSNSVLVMKKDKSIDEVNLNIMTFVTALRFAPLIF